MGPVGFDAGSLQPRHELIRDGIGGGCKLGPVITVINEERCSITPSGRRLAAP